MKKLLFPICGALLALTSCEQASVEGALSDTKSVTFNYTIEDAATRVSGNLFDNEDEISVFAKYNNESYINNAQYYYSEGKFVSAEPITIGVDIDKLSYLALYPYQENSELSGSFTIAEDQNVEGAYSTSDLLSAYVEDTENVTPKLSFYHKLSQIEVNIVKSDVSTDGAAVTINAMNNVNYDLESDSFEGYGDAVAINSASNGVDSFKAVVAPQTVEAGVKFITISIDGKDYSWQTTDATTLSSGSKYTCNAVIGNDEVTFETEIGDWTDGGELDVDFEEEPTVTECYLSDFDGTFVPAGTDWVILDEDPTAEAFEALRATLKPFEESVSITFPNLKKVPYKAFFQCYTVKSLSFPVATEVEEKAFQYAKTLTELNVPEVTDLEQYAFSTIPVLDSISLPKLKEVSNRAFSDSKKLRYISAPEATTIGEYALYSCLALETLDMPNVETIKKWGVYNCDSLVSVSFPKTVTVGEKAFFSCSKLESVDLSSATSFANSVFMNCNLLTTLSMAATPNSYLEKLGTDMFKAYPEGVTNGNITLTINGVNAKLIEGNTLTLGSASYEFKEIVVVGGESADLTLSSFGADGFEAVGTKWVITDQSATTEDFQPLLNYMKNLTENVTIEFPNLDALPESAFLECTTVAGLDLPLVESIGAKALQGTTSLSSLSIPSVTSIGEYSFAETALLKSVSLPNISEIPAYAFTKAQGMTAISAAAATKIGEFAFKDCPKLWILGVSSVQSIGEGSFYNCSAIKAVSMTKVESIADDAFYGCSTAASVMLPNITTLGNNVFENCDNVAKVTLATNEGVALASLGSDIFASTANGDNAANISLTLDEDNQAYVKDNTLTVGSQSYTFKNITIEGLYIPIEGDAKLDQFNKYSYPEGSEWVITDETAAQSSFDGLRAALNAVEETRTISLSFPNLKNIPDMGLWGVGAVSTVNAPALETIGKDAFYCCTALDAVYMPEVKSIGVEAFVYCYDLKSVTMPKVETIADKAFFTCKSLAIALDLPVVKEIGMSAFYTAPITSVSLPEATTINESAFSECRYLASVSLPKATILKNTIFSYCDSLVSLTLSTEPGAVIEELGTDIFKASNAYGNVAVNIDLTIGSDNSHYVDENSLTVKGVEYRMKSITVVE